MAGTALCLIIASCGGGASRHPATVDRGARTQTSAGLPPTFSAGYEQAWGEMKQVGAAIIGTINQVKRAQAKHHTVSDAQVAVEFANYASRMEPPVVALQGLTPPASVARVYATMAATSLALAQALRNFSSDASAHRVILGARALATYFAYANTIDNAALKIYGKLGLR